MAARKKPKRTGEPGRPYADPRLRRDRTVRVRVNTDELRRLYRAAGGPGGFSAWARTVLLRAADRRR